jgi:hypothetical protein
MASSDQPPPPDDQLAAPLLTGVPPPPPAFRPVGPLLLQVSPPPGSANPKEFYYDSSPDIIHGSFVAMQAFFSLRAHKVEVLECPDLQFFSTAHSGTIIRLLSELPVMVFVEGNPLLLEQAVVGITSSVGGFAIGGGTSTPVP